MEKIINKTKSLIAKWLWIMFIALTIEACHNNSMTKFKNNDDALSYYLGIYTGLTLKDAGYKEFDKYLFNEAIREVFNQKGFDKNAYKKADIIIAKYITKGNEVQNSITLEEGRKFLAKNKTRKEIKTTPSGLQYEVVKEGSGQIPLVNDSVILKFTGYTLNGSEFLNSEQYTQPYSILKTIRGCKEALGLMKEGSQYKVYLPAELAFGRNPLPGNILKSNMAVMFDIIVIHIVPQKDIK